MAVALPALGHTRSLGMLTAMIFICVKWKVKPEYADRWTELPAYVQETPLIATW